MHREIGAAAAAAYRSTNRTAARKLISDPTCPGPAVFVAARILLGVGWEAWLLETAVHELVKEGLADHQEDLIGSLQAIASTGAPWRDYRAFAATVNAFSDLPITTHALVPPEPHHMAASVVEMSVVFGLATVMDAEDYVPEFSDEVEAYVAAALAEQGFCCAPDELEFCQDRLDKLCLQHTCERSKKTAADEKGEAPKKDAPPPTNMQTHRYEEVVEYVKRRLEKCVTALKTLSQP